MAAGILQQSSIKGALSVPEKKKVLMPSSVFLRKKSSSFRKPISQAQSLRTVRPEYLIPILFYEYFLFAYLRSQIFDIKELSIPQYNLIFSARCDLCSFGKHFGHFYKTVLVTLRLRSRNACSTGRP
jgi:hypothetical protein